MRFFRRAWWILIALGLLLAGSMTPAEAHSSFIRSDPTPNAILAESPKVIHLWFSEPLETQFSRLTLYNAQGDAFAVPSVLDSTAKRLSLTPPSLLNGLYTVSWRAVSTTDGHATQGSFAFAIGDGFNPYSQATVDSSGLPFGSAALRWFNLLGLGLLVGLIGFSIFVGAHCCAPVPYAPLRVAWVLVGIGGVGILWLQASLVSGNSLTSLPHDLPTLISQTRFGHLWLARLLLWGLIALALWRGQLPVAFILSLGLLLTQSLFSHASGVPQDRLAALLSDWLHLLMMSLWLGGLVGLLGQLPPLRHDPKGAGRLVAQFSVYARALMFGLTLTGLYAAWLHIGTWQGFTQTDYGRALLVKLGLMLPLLAIAGLNMVLTSARLQAGQAIWVGYLKRLILLEMGLGIGILAAVGMMTASIPARTDLAERALAPVPIQPVVYAQAVGDLQVQVRVSSDVIGGNLYSVAIQDAAGQPFMGVTGVQLALQHQEVPLRPSYLRPQPKGGGVFTASGANINVPGRWGVEVSLEGVTVDSIYFEADFQAPPSMETPTVDLHLPPSQQTRVLLLLGLVMVMGSMGLLYQRQPIAYRLYSPAYLVLLAGMVFLLVGLVQTGADNLNPTPETARAETGFIPLPTAPARLQQLRTSALPMVITGNGTLYQPDEVGQWVSMRLNAQVNDVYMDTGNNLWAAAQDGLYLRAKESEEWERLQEISTYRIHDSHGFLFVLSDGLLIRFGSGAIHADESLILALPDTQTKGREMVMLGNHTHALLNGSSVYVTPDLGLTWQALNAPLPVQMIYTDANGHLLAVTDEGLYEWTWERGSWRSLGGLPNGQPITSMKLFQNRLFTLAGGKFYYRTGGSWKGLDIPDSNDAYLNGMALHYPDTLWLLDAAQGRLWSSADGMNWHEQSLTLQ